MDEVMLRRLFEGDPTAACLAGTDGVIHDGNPAFARRFGFLDPELARGARIDTLLADAPAWRRAAEAHTGGPPRLDIGGAAGPSSLLLRATRLVGDPSLTRSRWFSDLTSGDDERAGNHPARLLVVVVAQHGHDL
jgi:PAS domain-containing protein